MDKRLNEEIKDYIHTLFDEFKLARSNQAVELIEELKKDIERLVKWKVESELTRLESLMETEFNFSKDMEKRIDDLKDWIDKFKNFVNALNVASQAING